MPGKDKNTIGYFSTLYRARKRLRVKDDILKIKLDSGLFLKELFVLNGMMTKDLVHIIHTSVGTSHFGTSKTMEIFQQYFYCPGALHYIKKYTSSCKPCIDAKKLELGRPELGSGIIKSSSSKILVNGSCQNAFVITNIWLIITISIKISIYPNSFGSGYFVARMLLFEE